MAKTVIVAYSPKPGMSEKLMVAVSKHLTVLRAEKLVTEQPPYVMRATDGTIVEVFSWIDAAAIQRAHSTPAVQALWQEFFAACDMKNLNTLAECGQMFAEFESVAI